MSNKGGKREKGREGEKEGGRGERERERWVRKEMGNTIEKQERISKLLWVQTPLLRAVNHTRNGVNSLTRA